MEIAKNGQSEKTVIRVQGMDCNDEVEAIKSVLSLPGIASIEANIIQAQVTVNHDHTITKALLIKKIKSVGVSVDDAGAMASEGKKFSPRVISVVSSGLALLLSLTAIKLNPGSDISMALSFIAIICAGWLILPKAIRATRDFRLDMNVLMTVAVLGAVAIGEHIEGASVVFLFSLAELLESLSLERARRSIQSLLKLSPETALLKSESVTEVSVQEVKKGDLILVRSGSRIPLDGEVEAGNSTVNQAPITGESLSVEKKVGDRVLAGTLNEEGSLEIRVTQAFKDTKLSQIIRLIEDAQKQKAPTQRFVDSFARFYTPIVFMAAILILFVPPVFFGEEWSVWVYKSLVLLVIACPCALVISTPISIVSGLTAMARRGVLIKGGAGLEAIGKLQVLAVDKTGTITEGNPRVLQILPQSKFSEDEVLAIAASIDLHSTHPLARAVVNAANEKQINFPKSTGYQSITGRGAEAVIDGHFYFVGNHKFVHDNAICSDAVEALLSKIENNAQSVVIVGHRPHAGCQGEVLGLIGMGDSIRKDAKESVRALHAAGIKNIVMLSGDNEKTVQAISKQVGIDEAYGDLLPGDKVLKVKELKNRFGSVAMIGDGVNDAPAMASATLGIAMGASGTDTAIETSDITLMQDRLGGIIEAIQMGQRVMRMIWFNTSFAIAVKILFLALSLLGYSSLWMAIAADTGATILVIGNALRLLVR